MEVLATVEIERLFDVILELKGFYGNKEEVTIYHTECNHTYMGRFKSDHPYFQSLAVLS